MAATTLASCSYSFFNLSIPQNVSRKRTQASPNRAEHHVAVMETRTRKLVSRNKNNSKRLRPERPPDSDSDLNLNRNLYLLDSYVGSGRFEDALYLFDEMPHSEAQVWNVMIKGFADNGLFQETVDFHRRMEIEGVRGDNMTYPFVIKACAALSLMMEGQRVHGKVLKLGFHLDVYVCNSLITMYAKLGCLEYAVKVFDEMPVRDLVSWNSMIGGYFMFGDVRNSLLCLQDMVESGTMPDRFSLMNALGICSETYCLRNGKEIHARVIRSELEFDIKVQTSLIDAYSKCKRLDYAERLFHAVSQKNVVVWNAMLGGYAFNHRSLESFDCLKRMQEAHKPDAITAINILPLCEQVGLLVGKSIHGYAIRKGFLPHLLLETALVDMYGRCDGLEYAERVFYQETEKDLVSWNAMITAYVQNGLKKEGLDLFRILLDEAIQIDVITISSILPAYVELASLMEARQMQGLVMKMMLDSHVYISNLIVHVYAKHGNLEAARKLFDGMSYKNIDSWNAIISAYVQNGLKKEGLDLFRILLGEAIQLDVTTISSILPAYAELASLMEARQVHGLVMKVMLDPDVYISNSIVLLYAKLGDLEAARKLFDCMPYKNIDSWNAMIAAYGIHGFGKSSIQLFSDMREIGIQPNAKTFHALLSSCRTSGMVNEALDYFNLMITRYHIDPELEHFSCMLGLLSRV